MTDFVDRLLGRSGAPVLRPIVPSLFEPVPVVAEEVPLGTFAPSLREREIPVVERSTVERIESSTSERFHTHSSSHTENLVTARESVLERWHAEVPVQSEPVPAPVPVPVERVSAERHTESHTMEKVAAQPNTVHTVRRETVAQQAVPPVVVPVRHSPETTVHISIGRVEVKPSAAPTVPRRTEVPRVPALSLDEYLRERGGR